MSTSIRFGFLVLASLVVLFANGSFCRAQGHAAEIKDLRKKHTEVLDQALAEVAKKWNAGTMGGQQAYSIKVEVFVSKLRLAYTVKERIAALKEISENAKLLADYVERSAEVSSKPKV